MGGKCLLFVTILCFVIGQVACWPRNKNSEESEFDAITAASNRLFGKNVRGYMWALTTDSPSLFAQAPVVLNSPSAPQVVVFDPFADNASGAAASPPQAAIASKPTPLPTLFGAPEPVSVSGTKSSLKSEYFQCWYYAETAVYEKLEGEALKTLFLNKAKTKRINNNFFDVRHLYGELERSEALKNLESFALAALPASCFLFNSIGPLKGNARGALSSAFCSLSLASLTSTRKPSGDGWGSDRARQHIQNQLRARVNDLDEVNWDVLFHLKKKVGEFNSPDKFAETTQVQCPTNERWVAELMGPTTP